MSVAALHTLPSASLRALASSLTEGMLSAGITHFALHQTAGAAAVDVEGSLRYLQQLGMTTRQMAVVVMTIADVRDAQPDPSKLFDLVLSGPDLPGVPTGDTAAVLHTMISHAKQDVLLVGYAIHNGRRLFGPLAARMVAVPSLKVTFCLDISRPLGDTSIDTEIVSRFGAEFRSKHWPWPPKPDVFYDPRSLLVGSEYRASLHAKCVVVDRCEALVTSANFTEAAQRRNIEAGILVRYRPMVERIVTYFEGLRATGQFVPCHLPL